MAGGSITLNVQTYGQLPAVAQRVLCWALTDAGKIRTTTNGGTAIVIPEEVIAGKGALVLKRGGSDIVSGYVAGTNVFASVINGGAIEQNANTCPASTTQPTITTIATNVGSNPAAITLNYANAVGAGTVNILWGDGTSTLGAAESGASNHTYAFGPGVYTITITDATVPADTASTVIKIP